MCLLYKQEQNLVGMQRSSWPAITHMCFEQNAAIVIILAMHRTNTYLSAASASSSFSPASCSSSASWKHWSLLGHDCRLRRVLCILTYKFVVPADSQCHMSREDHEYSHCMRNHI